MVFLELKNIFSGAVFGSFSLLQQLKRLLLLLPTFRCIFHLLQGLEAAFCCVVCVCPVRHEAVLICDGVLLRCMCLITFVLHCTLRNLSVAKLTVSKLSPAPTLFDKSFLLRFYRPLTADARSKIQIFGGIILGFLKKSGKESWTGFAGRES